MKPNFSWQITSNLVVFGLAHALVDLISASIIFSIFGIEGFEKVLVITLAYNFLAFGMQTPLGIMTDLLKMPKFLSIVSLVISLLALLLFIFKFNFWTAVILIGFGNALFHVSAGTISLNLTPKKASAPGIFVAPGAIGLFIGGIIGKTGLTMPIALTLVVVSIIFIWLIYITKIPKINYKVGKGKIDYLIEIVIILLLISIVVRSFVGLALVLPWKNVFYLSVLSVFFVFLGKFLGGIIADKFGWVRISVVALLLSALLLSFGSAAPVLAIAGLFLFNIVMPITLTGISNALPGQPGLSFGLNCLALFLGTLLALAGFKIGWGMNLVLIIISAVVIYFGLKSLLKLRKK